MNKKGFTLIEILVVAKIMSLLASMGVTSYSTLNQNSRDAKRKADAEQIRSALEMYKNTNGNYPISLNNLTAADPSGNIYLSEIPVDPKGVNSYYYGPISSPPNNYTIGVVLENTAAVSNCSGGPYSCGTENCNYCLGPYGQK